MMTTHNKDDLTQHKIVENRATEIILERAHILTTSCWQRVRMTCLSAGSIELLLTWKH